MYAFTIRKANVNIFYNFFPLFFSGFFDFLEPFFCGNFFCKFVRKGLEISFSSRLPFGNQETSVIDPRTVMVS